MKLLFRPELITLMSPELETAEDADLETGEQNPYSLYKSALGNYFRELNVFWFNQLERAARILCILLTNKTKLHSTIIIINSIVHVLWTNIDKFKDIDINGTIYRKRHYFSLDS